AVHFIFLFSFRVKDLSNPAHRFKVEKNVNQLLMTGIVTLHRDCNAIVVEGGAKQHRKFKRLMLHRIKWNESRRGAVISKSDSVGALGDGSSLCRLVWEGTVKQRAFGKIQFKTCPTELYAREQFKKRDVEHYWDLAYSGAILEAAGDDNT
ncbi:unnamed protein product, partial [Protopolystoma xenopodis]